MMPKESFLARLNGEETDYIPFFPRDLTLGIGALGLGYDQFLSTSSPQLSAECVLALLAICGYDATVGYIRTTTVSPFGGTISKSTNGMPQLSQAPFSNIDRMDAFSPQDAICRITENIRESSRIVAEKRPDIALVCNVCTPLLTATILRGLESFIMDTALNMDIVDRLMVFGTETAELVLEDTIIDRTDCVFLAGANDNPDIIGEDTYGKLSLPGVKGMTEISHDKGLPTIFHPHGAFSEPERKTILSDTIGTGIDGFQFAENNDPVGILKATDGRCAILGGVDAYTTLMLGDRERIIRETDGFLNALEGHNYIPMCSCSLHLGTPIESIKAMSEAVHSYRSRHV